MDSGYWAADVVGIVCTLIVSYQIGRFALWALYKNVVCPAFGINAVQWTKLPKWAVVTGSTDGIGKSYAYALASKGFNIVLVSRNSQKLQSIALFIAETYGVKTKCIQADFTDKSDQIYHNIDRELHGLDVGVLINNVGVSYSYPEYFLDVPDAIHVFDNIIKCNVESLIRMCHIVMPTMVARQQGVIVNVSSLSATVPSPLLSVYSASKAFVSKFSDDLATEYRNTGLIIQCVQPGFVATNMSKIRHASLMAPNTETYVASALSAVGIHKITTGYLPHTLLSYLINTADRMAPNVLRPIVIRTMENLRANAIKHNLQRSQ